MNDRWFNFAIAITIFTILVNGFILVAGSQPDAQGNYNSIFAGTSTGLDYTNIKQTSDFTLGTSPSLSTDSSTSPSSDSGFTPATDNLGRPAGLQVWDYLILGAGGFEALMLKLAGVFVMASPIFYALAGIGLFCKAIVGAWLFSVVLRPIFGRVW